MNKIYDCSSNSNYTTMLYGLDSKTDKIIYLLDKVNEQNNRELLNRFQQTQIENANELNNAVNSKYPYYKMREPLNINDKNGSGLKMKKQFKFNRK